MHIHVYRLILVAVLLFAAPAFAQGPQGHYFPGGQLTGGGGTSGNFSSLVAGPGGIRITGGSTNGSDQVSNVSVNGVQNVNAYGTGDLGARVNAAIVNLGSQGGTVYIPAGTYNFSQTIQCPINADIPINIVGAAQTSDYNFTGTVLQYTGSGDAINQMMVGHQNARGCQLRDLTLDGGGSCNGTATTNPNCHTIGFHIGGTIYSRTENVLMRNFTDSCIELDNQPDPQENNGGHWTERFGFDKTTFSECGYGSVSGVASTHLYPNASIYFHNSTGNVSGSGGNASFMHGQLNVFFGLFGNQNGIVIDGNATNSSPGGQVTGAVVEVNGNMAPDFTGNLIMLTNNSYLGGKVTLNPECMNTTPCTRMNLDATSHVGIQTLNSIPGQWTDHLPFGSDLQEAFSDTRMFTQTHATCVAAYGMNAGTTVELFNLVPGFGSAIAGILTVNGTTTGNGTTQLWNMATMSCNQGATVNAGTANSSLSLGKSTVYAGGVPYTISETCHPSAVVGSGTSANPQYPAGSTTYYLTNNQASGNAFFTVAYLNILNSVAGPGGRIYGPTTASGTYQAEVCM